MLKAISPMLTESFEKKQIFLEAEQWRHKQLVKQLLAAEARQKETEQPEQPEQPEPQIQMEEIITKDNKKTK